MKHRTLLSSGLLLLGACFNPDGGELDTDSSGSTIASSTTDTTIGTSSASTTTSASSTTDTTTTTASSSTTGPTTTDSTTSEGTGTTGQVDECPGPYDVDYGTSVLNVALNANLQGIDTVDLDGDDRLDLLVSNYASNSIFVFLADGPGTFAAPTEITVPGPPSHVRAAAIADQNADVIVEYYDAAGMNPGPRTWRTRGVGDGTFQLSAAVGSMARFELGDLDGDDRLDLVGNEEGSVQRRMSNASEVFGNAVMITAGGAPLALGDFDGDVDLDLVFATSSTSFDLLPGLGDGSFGAAAATLTASSVSMSVSTGDFNDDGDLDVVSTTVGGGNTVIDLYYGDGTLAFPQTDQISATNYNFVVQGADVNSDGIDDIVSTYGGISGNGLSVVLSEGDGNFGTVDQYPCAMGCNNPRAFAVGDFNDDCVLDAAVVTGSDLVGVVLYLSQ